MCPYCRIPLDGKGCLQYLADLRLGIIHIPEDKPLGLGGGFHTGRDLADGQPLGAEIAFFHHPAHPGRVFGILGLDERLAVCILAARIAPVETPESVKVTYSKLKELALSLDTRK